MNIRSSATKILATVLLQEKSLTETLKQYKNKDFSFLQEICYGSIRWYHQLEFIANKLLKKPLKKKDFDIFILIIVGLYQIKFTRTPAFAAVKETVSAAETLNKTWAKGVINAILRKYLANQKQILHDLSLNPTAYYSHPEWLLGLIQQDYPMCWQDILQANNQKAPLFLRINQTKINPKDYASLLTQNNLNFKTIEEYPLAIKLINPIIVSSIPGFLEGLCSIQDLSGQQIATALTLKPNQDVLDACAAPGSKTCHLLETEPNLNKLIALDINKTRCQMIKENIHRLHLDQKTNIDIIAADANQISTWWDNTLFDRILIDAPCSGTGVIRRHPDIKILKKPEDIMNFRRQQQKLLNNLWPLLKKGGKLVYSTCSILKCENEQPIKDFLTNNSCATLKESKQLLPKIDSNDGFYFAVLEKSSSN